MDPRITAVTLHRIVSDGVSILPVEAVALVRQIWQTVDSDRRHGSQGRIPALDQVRLRSTGELRVSDDHSPGEPEVQPVESITALGTLLATLLSPGREWATNPAQLRSIVRRAMAPSDHVTAFDSNAAFGSIGDFLRALDDFAPADRTTDLRPLFERWHTTTAAQFTGLVDAAADSLLHRSVSRSTAAVSEAGVDLLATTGQQETNLDASQEDNNKLHQYLHEPDGRVDDALTLFESEGSDSEGADSEGSVAVEDSDRWPPPPVVQPRSETPVPERMTNSRRTITTMVAIAAIAIAATTLVFVRPSFEPPSTSHGPAVNDRDPDPLVPAPTVGTIPAAPEPPPSTNPAPLGRSEKSDRQKSEADRTSSAAVVTMSASDSTAVPIIRSTDVDNEPAFSPSFDGTESAMFFHAGRDGSLRKASMDGDGSVLEVTTIVNDGARNYHVRASPDGSRIAFDSDRDGERAVYVATRDGRNLRRVSGPGYAAVPTWSPDSARLAFIRAEPGRPRVWNVWTAEVATNELRRLTSHSVGQAWGGSWFPDNRRLAYSHEDRLLVLDTISGDERVFPSPVKGSLVRTPAVSPDGRSVVFQVFRQGTWLLDLSDGTMRRILEDPSAEEYAWSPDGRRIAFHSRRSGEWGIWMMAPGR
jgi:Tol biopolymer transport system component